MRMEGYRTPTNRDGIFGYFDTGGQFWTPEWDYEYNQPKDVHEVLMPDGKWHEFDSFVSRAYATKYRIENTDFIGIAALKKIG